MTENPWFHLPEKPPFVVPKDKEQVLAFNSKAKPHHFLRLDFIPEPFVGNPEAPVLLLANNPGIKSQESAAFRKPPQFASRIRKPWYIGSLLVIRSCTSIHP